MKPLITRLSLFVLTLLIVGSCATSQQVIEDSVSRTYTKNFKTVVSLFQEAARRGSLYYRVITEKPGYVVFKINKHNYREGQIQTTPSAVVHIKELNSNKVLLAIQKPDYPPTIPRHAKLHYDRIIYSELEELLDES